LAVPADAKDQVPTKLSQTSASTKDQFSLTVEVPGGCEMASIYSDDFAIVNTRDFKPEAKQPYPHLQPTGHVYDVNPNSNVFRPISGNTPPSGASDVPVLRSYVLKARHPGTLTLGPFQVLCPDGPLETQAQSIQITGEEDSLGKTVAIQDFSASRPAAAIPAHETVDAPVPATRPPEAAAPAAKADVDLSESFGEIMTEKNMLIIAVVGLCAAVAILLLQNQSKGT